ncbi:Hypothetical protein R9X50_00517200 [Acrodontium crateriforme]|uniref:Pcc1-domain-containing protein n=1 Tax=Acrodontium crateriforme TaxID=150365 RepID=A0AAQ3RBA8_9PEZI|nr:Hypothetical protein R9X50_00517200 [Acrodontium crateriforme]
MSNTDGEFPCTLTINTPFPTSRLAKVALGTLSVDEELSPLVKRAFSLISEDGKCADADNCTVLKTEYRATTNRMLRVAVNGFFESLTVVVQVMEELDVDVIHEKGFEDLQGVQGVEIGLTGTTLTGA